MPSWSDENGLYWWNPPGTRWEAVEIPHAPVGEPNPDCRCAYCEHHLVKLSLIKHVRRECTCRDCCRWRVKRKRAAVDALRWLAKQRCKPRNCGSVCLCPSCNARLALELMEP